MLEIGERPDRDQVPVGLTSGWDAEVFAGIDPSCARHRVIAAPASSTQVKPTGPYGRVCAISISIPPAASRNEASSGPPARARHRATPENASSAAHDAVSLRTEPVPPTAVLVN